MSKLFDYFSIYFLYFSFILLLATVKQQYDLILPIYLIISSTQYHCDISVIYDNIQDNAAMLVKCIEAQV